MQIAKKISNGDGRFVKARARVSAKLDFFRAERMDETASSAEDTDFGRLSPIFYLQERDFSEMQMTRGK